ncbi:MAG: DUF433 domain-containing protein [Actinomycetota bacterium]|nr:DUF433 domain-containing protein [Actinomycetota bacterium]
MANKGNATTELEVMVPAEKAATLAGITRQRLWYWEETGLVKPSIRRKLSPKNVVRLYGLDALTELLVAVELRQQSDISLQHIRAVLRFLRQQGYDRPLRQIRFAVQGSEIFFQYPDGTWEGSRRPSQIVEPRILNLEPIRKRVSDAVKRGRAPADFGYVVKRKKVMGSKPIFKGTRVPVAVVLQYFNAGRSTADILRSYPALSEEDLSKALLLTAVGRRLRAGESVASIQARYPNLSRIEIESAREIGVA